MAIPLKDSLLVPFADNVSTRISASPGTWNFTSGQASAFAVLYEAYADAYTAMMRLNLPPAYMLIHRTFAGGVGVLSQLEARVPFRQVLLDSLPGFAD